MEASKIPAGGKGGRRAFGRIKGRGGKKNTTRIIGGRFGGKRGEIGREILGALPNRYAWPRASYTAARRKTKKKRDPMNS